MTKIELLKMQRIGVSCLFISVGLLIFFILAGKAGVKILAKGGYHSDSLWWYWPQLMLPVLIVIGILWVVSFIFLSISRGYSWFVGIALSPLHIFGLVILYFMLPDKMAHLRAPRKA